MSHVASQCVTRGHMPAAPTKPLRQEPRYDGRATNPLPVHLEEGHRAPWRICSAKGSTHHMHRRSLTTLLLLLPAAAARAPAHSASAVPTPPWARARPRTPRPLERTRSDTAPPAHERGSSTACTKASLAGDGLSWSLAGKVKSRALLLFYWQGVTILPLPSIRSRDEEPSK